MKKDNLKTLFIVFSALNIVFNVAYILFYHIFSIQDIGVDLILPIFNTITAIILSIGILRQKKSLCCVYFIAQSLVSFIAIIIHIINCFQYSFAEYVQVKIVYCFSSLRSITFNIIMLLFVIVAFRLKEKTDIIPIENNLITKDQSEFSADMLIEYKNLLDIGAITQEEFENKKKELINL